MFNHRLPAFHGSTPLARIALASAAVAITLGSAAAPASAQQPGAGEGGELAGSTWGLGIGAISAQQPYTGIDRDNKVLPVILFENRYVRLFGPTLEAKLPSLALGGSQRLDVRAVVQYDGNGYESDDAPILAGMAKRRSGFWAGAKVKWDNDIANVGVEWLADVSSHSKGQRLNLELERSWRFGERVVVTPRLAAQWSDRKTVDYYFGVRDSEAVGGRPAYDGRSGTSIDVGVRTMFNIDAHQALLFNVGVTALPSEIRDSPIVDRSTENRVLVAYLYRF